MSWPKKFTRKLHIQEQEYLWHLSGNEIWKEKRVTIGSKRGRYVLLLDPYSSKLEISPSEIKKALMWALNKGWSPLNGPNRNLAHSPETGSFYWLPEDAKYAYETKN